VAHDPLKSRSPDTIGRLGNTPIDVLCDDGRVINKGSALPAEAKLFEKRALCSSSRTTRGLLRIGASFNASFVLCNSALTGWRQRAIAAFHLSKDLLQKRTLGGGSIFYDKSDNAPSTVDPETI
jgi:hypothetical protein